MVEAHVLAPPPLPSFAACNIRSRSISRSQKEQWSKKLDNVRSLTKDFTMTALLETHVGGPKADLFFCKHVDDVSRCYEHGIAVLAQRAWAELSKPELQVVL